VRLVWSELVQAAGGEGVSEERWNGVWLNETRRACMLGGEQLDMSHTIEPMITDVQDVETQVSAGPWQQCTCESSR